MCERETKLYRPTNAEAYAELKALTEAEVPAEIREAVEDFRREVDREMTRWFLYGES